ncbi:MAG TPA: cysteine--tRNA ligase [Mycobacteriales bacterium]|nr:cysteine--tRNA ligase [Mycobacteriales bacterium]
MPLTLTDTRSREARPFVPVVEGTATVYVCGPTVQAPPHVGHARSAVAFDILRRWLSASGYDVTFVRNVTDIDDKIIHEAAHAGITNWAVAEQNTRAFNAAYDALGVLPPTVEPRATGHVPEMIALMRTLIDKGHAYASGGDVYFDVRSFDRYGELSGQRPDAMMQTEKVDPTRPKRDPLDFALWKAHKPGEPFWDTPWGPGRPGWHLECSAMSVKYLGQPFDVHGGGYDLVFPHHENENAQSACAGDGFANYWLHNGLVNTGGEKMSKSLGNSLVVADVLASGVRPQVLRYLLGGAHYRSNIEYSAAGLAEAAAAYGRIETFVRNAATDGTVDEAAWAEFAAAMDDDLAVSRALGVVHTTVGRGNAALAEGDRPTAADCRATVRRMLDVLGLDPVGQWPAAAGDLHETVGALVEIALEARSAARARKDFAEADAIRDRLAAAGVVVEDTAGGVRWHLGSA